MSMSEMTKILIEAAKKDGSYYATYPIKKEKQTTWVGLTDEERRHLRKCNQQHDAFALAVEALLKEKNTKGGAA